MKALSVRQPWAWAIIFALKNIENRGATSPRLTHKPRSRVMSFFLGNGDIESQSERCLRQLKGERNKL
jgi:hypothetical protein